MNNKNIPTFVCLIGLSGSGKSTKAKELAKSYDAVILSSDALRKELYNDENHQAHNSEVFDELHKRAKENIKNGKSVIFDATNIIMKRRIYLLHQFSEFPCKKIAMIMATDYEKCLEYNEIRNRNVPEYSIRRHYKTIQFPYFYEGWDEIVICRNKNNITGNLHNEIKEMMNLSHDNHHHSLTVGEHCLKCHEECKKLLKDSDMPIERQNIILTAAYYHDLGKPFCKIFQNYKGKATEEAHYYGHQNVSAYKYICGEIVPDDIALHVAVLIQWHMEHFLFFGEGKNKFNNLLGKELIEELEFLHKADLAAH